MSAKQAGGRLVQNVDGRLVASASPASLTRCASPPEIWVPDCPQITKPTATSGSSLSTSPVHRKTGPLHPRTFSVSEISPTRDPGFRDCTARLCRFRTPHRRPPKNISILMTPSPGNFRICLLQIETNRPRHSCGPENRVIDWKSSRIGPKLRNKRLDRVRLMGL